MYMYAYIYFVDQRKTLQDKNKEHYSLAHTHTYLAKNDNSLPVDLYLFP